MLTNLSGSHFSKDLYMLGENKPKWGHFSLRPLFSFYFKPLNKPPLKAFMGSSKQVMKYIVIYINILINIVIYVRCEAHKQFD